MSHGIVQTLESASSCEVKIGEIWSELVDFWEDYVVTIKYRE